MILAVTAFAAAAGLLLANGADVARATAQAGEGLTRLLRGMAALKAMIAAGATTAVLWRLAAPVTPARLAAYAVACAAMAAGPGLIWNIVNLGLGALLLHAGLIGAVVLLWRDPETARRLSSAIALRRRAVANR